MLRKFSTLLLICTLLVIGLQVLDMNLLPGRPAKKPNPSPLAIYKDNPAPQSPGPALPLPLLPENAQDQHKLAMENEQGKIPATPADPYAYALTWEEELAKIKGIHDPVVVIWQRSLFLAYRGKEVSIDLVKTQVIKRIKYLEPRFAHVYISDKRSARIMLLRIQQKVKLGGSPGDYSAELKEKFYR